MHSILDCYTDGVYSELFTFHMIVNLYGVCKETKNLIHDYMWSKYIDLPRKLQYPICGPKTIWNILLCRDLIPRESIGYIYKFMHKFAFNHRFSSILKDLSECDPNVFFAHRNITPDEDYKLKQLLNDDFTQKEWYEGSGAKIETADHFEKLSYLNIGTQVAYKPFMSKHFVVATVCKIESEFCYLYIGNKMFAVERYQRLLRMEKNSWAQSYLGHLISQLRLGNSPANT